MESRSKLDGWTMGLLALMLSMAAWTVSSSDWAPGLEMLWLTALAGLLLGATLAHSTFRRLPAYLLALGYGAAWIAFTVIPFLPRAGGARGLGEQLIALGRHVGEWVWLLFQTGVGKDNFIFLLSLMVVFWLLGFLAAWFTFRVTRALRVALPPGLVILVNLYYYGGRAHLAIFLYAYFVCVLLYLVRVNYMLREREWRRFRVGYDDDLRGAFLRGGSIVTLVALVAAWAAPEVAPLPQVDDLWRQISRPIRSIEDGFNRLFSALEGEGPALTNPFGRTLGFAGPRTLGEAVLMDVYIHASPDNADALARYWRAGAYDVYTSNGWRSSSGDSYVFSPGAPPLGTPYLQRSNVRQTFTFYFPRTSLLIAAAQPVYFDRDAEASAERLPISAGGSASSAGAPAAQSYVDPSFVISRDALRAGDAYDAISSLSIADVDTLRAAGTHYPAWVLARYLQLPGDFPQRVKELARQIVTEAGATNPFDQATALEHWLRRNITYDEKIPGPRPGQDGVDYVLFETRAGYCDYYASAMVSMARALGLPARVAVGYARGRFEPSGSVYRVRERDAHSWVEVYFPDYGWVEFEPTAAQPLISRPISAEEQAESERVPVPTPRSPGAERESRFEDLEENREALGDPSILFRQSLPRGLFILAAVLAGVAAIALGVIYVVENHGLRNARGARWAYARLVRVSAWLGIPLQPHHTPYEHAAMLVDVAPASRPAIDAIAGDFVRETFGRDESDTERVQSIYRQARAGLWWAGLRRRVRGHAPLCGVRLWPNRSP